MITMIFWSRFILHYYENNKYHYDNIAILNVKSEFDLIGTITQDVITKPFKKIFKKKNFEKKIKKLRNVQKTSFPIFFEMR